MHNSTTQPGQGNIELLPKVSQVSPSQGRCRMISVPKGTTDRRSRAKGSLSYSNCFIDPKPGEMWTLVFETAGGGTHRQPSWSTLKPNASRGSQSTQLSELMVLWVFNCRDLLARCNVCGYDASEKPVTRDRDRTKPSIPSHLTAIFMKHSDTVSSAPSA